MLTFAISLYSSGISFELYSIIFSWLFSSFATTVFSEITLPQYLHVVFVDPSLTQVAVSVLLYPSCPFAFNPSFIILYIVTFCLSQLEKSFGKSVRKHLYSTDTEFMLYSQIINQVSNKHNSDLTLKAGVFLLETNKRGLPVSR